MLYRCWYHPFHCKYRMFDVWGRSRSTNLARMQHWQTMIGSKNHNKKTLKLAALPKIAIWMTSHTIYDCQVALVASLSAISASESILISYSLLQSLLNLMPIWPSVLGSGARADIVLQFDCRLASRNRSWSACGRRKLSIDLKFERHVSNRGFKGLYMLLKQTDC